MANLSTFAEVAALAGDPARAGMLHALMDGRALTASELARVAGVTPQTASGHLARLATAGLLSVEKQGRHRYHRIASPGVAQMMESIMQVAAGLDPKRPPLTVGPKDAALRAARTCYDHLAGRLGVAVADACSHDHAEGRARLSSGVQGAVELINQARDASGLPFSTT
jgi:DNA-binding transcriptional ArsR family regulator